MKEAKQHNDEEINLKNEENVSTQETPDGETEKIDVKALESQISEWQDKYVRKVAEFENYKRRTENDQLNLLKYAAESFIIKLLPVIDDFERSLQHLKDSKEISTIEEGIKLVYNKFLKTLEEQGVKKIESVGKPFDVHYHEAILQQPNDNVPPHTVLDEILCGYVYKDKVIRHAQVIVSADSNHDEEQ